MYEENLERFIEVCVADGVLTEAEKRALRKKAAECGADPDEVVIYAEGLMAERASKRSSSKEGRRVTCPACGASLPAMVGECPECGHEIRGNEASEAMRRFAAGYSGCGSEKARANYIKSFPVPANKEDLAEFTSFAWGQLKEQWPLSPFIRLLLIWAGWTVLALVMVMCGMQTGISLAICIFVAVLTSYFAFTESGVVKSAWQAKLKSVLMTADMLQTSDGRFAANVAEIRRSQQGQQRKQTLIGGLLVALIVALGIGIAVFSNRNSAEAEATKAQIEALVEQGEYEKADAMLLGSLPSGMQDENEGVYYRFLTDCATRMCKAGDYDGARSFVEPRLHFFHERSWQYPHNTHYYEDVKEEMEKLISRYESQ